jgi:hypothetical protein
MKGGDIMSEHSPIVDKNPWFPVLCWANNKWKEGHIIIG